MPTHWPHRPTPPGETAECLTRPRWVNSSIQLCSPPPCYVHSVGGSPDGVYSLQSRSVCLHATAMRNHATGRVWVPRQPFLSPELNVPRQYSCFFGLPDSTFSLRITMQGMMRISPIAPDDPDHVDDVSTHSSNASPDVRTGCPDSAPSPNTHTPPSPVFSSRRHPDSPPHWLAAARGRGAMTSKANSRAACLCGFPHGRESRTHPMHAWYPYGLASFVFRYQVL